MELGSRGSGSRLVSFLLLFGVGIEVLFEEQVDLAIEMARFEGNEVLGILGHHKFIVKASLLSLVGIGQLVDQAGDLIRVEPDSQGQLPSNHVEVGRLLLFPTTIFLGRVEGGCNSSCSRLILAAGNDSGNSRFAFSL